MPSESCHKLKIALGVPEWDPYHEALMDRPADAAFVLLADLARGLANRGHSVLHCAPRGPNEIIITSNPGQPGSGQQTWTAGPVFNLTEKAAWRAQKLLKVPYLNYFSNYRFMDASLHALKDVDVIYERNGLYNSGLAMAARRLHKPYVVLHEADQVMELALLGRPVAGLLRKRADQILRYNLNAADAIICVSEPGKQHLVRDWNIPPEKIAVYPNAVDVNCFRPDSNERAMVRISLGLGERPVVLFVGNFYRWHDVATLLRAFALCLKASPEACLLLVGDGEQRAEMSELACSLGLENAVKFTGRVPHTEVPRYMAAADAAVVPYPPLEQEMWFSPMKLFEYMASGKAVVASCVGQITELIHDGENGLLVPPGDAPAMAVALTRLLREPTLRSVLGRQAREDAVNGMSWDHYLVRLEHLFESVIARRPVTSI